jgi:hypothetical protein
MVCAGIDNTRKMWMNVHNSLESCMALFFLPTREYYNMMSQEMNKVDVLFIVLLLLLNRFNSTRSSVKYLKNIKKR